MRHRVSLPVRRTLDECADLYIHLRRIVFAMRLPGSIIILIAALLFQRTLSRKQENRPK